MTDLGQLAVETLAATGTERGLALAAELERGLNRQKDPKRFDRPTLEQMEAESAAQRQRQERMLAQLRPAQPAEWAEWVNAYLQTTNKPVIRRLARLTAEDVYVATQHLEVHPLYGSSALRIILPAGIQDWGGETGHTELFGYAEGRVTYRGFHDQRWPHQVWVYVDTELPEGGTVTVP